MFGKKNLVKCNHCKCLLNKEDAQSIKVVQSSFSPYGLGEYEDRVYYCQAHKVNYDVMRITRFNGVRYFVEVPAHDREVRRDGSAYQEDSGNAGCAGEVPVTQPEAAKRFVKKVKKFEKAVKKSAKKHLKGIK